MAIAKYLGGDKELSTTGVGRGGDSVQPWQVTKQVLRHIDAAFRRRGRATWTRQSRHRYDGYASPFAIDCLRHWAPNGQCYYSDMSHVEVCTASTLYPRRYAAECIAALQVAEAARLQAEAAADDGQRYSLSTANVDLLDPTVAWGSHTSVSVTKQLWEDLLLQQRHPPVLGFVASSLAALIAFFGSGYLLPFKDGSVLYSLSARAHHLSLLKSHSTTDAFRRGLLNSRREPHGEGHDRLHLIGFDYSLAGAALAASLLQCVLAAAEEGACSLNLYDPVRALRSWSWSLDIRTGQVLGAATLADGRQLTLPAFLRELCHTLLRMCRSGLITEAVAPEAVEMLERTIRLTEQLEQGLLTQCARHLDWAAKLLYLTDFCQQHDQQWEDPATRLADHDFANCDPRRGPFWRLWEAGLIDPLVSPDQVEACLEDGPPESRDWARGRMIQKFYHELTDADWSYLEMRRSEDRWGSRLRIELPRLWSLNRQAFEATLDRAETAADLEQLLQQDEDVVTDTADPMDDIRSQLAEAPYRNEAPSRDDH